MTPEERRILEMLSAGKLTPVEADRLLRAVAGIPPPAIAAPASGSGPEAMVGEVLSASALPLELQRFRRFWRLPFLIALTLLLFFVLLLAAVLSNRGWDFTLGAICLLGFALLAAGGMALAWWSRSAPWVHIRVQSEAGSRVRISFPFAPRLARWALAFSRRLVDGDARAGLDTAAAMIEAVANNIQTTGEPLTFAVNDQVDGEKVLVYVG